MNSKVRKPLFRDIANKERPTELEFSDPNVVSAEDAKVDGAATGGAEGETEGVDRSHRDDGASLKAVSNSPQDLQTTSTKAATP